MTIEELMEELRKYNPKGQVYSRQGGRVKFVGQTNEYIEGVIISDMMPVPNRFCANCGSILFEETENIGYPYYCPDCDQNLCEMETETNFS